MMRAFYKIRHSLIFKYTLSLLLMLTFVLGTGFSIFYFSVQNLLNKSVNQKAELICRENVNRFDQTFFKGEEIAKMLATSLAQKPIEEWQEFLCLAFKNIAMTGNAERNILAIGAAGLPENGNNQFSLVVHPYGPDGLPTNKFQLLTTTEYADKDWFLDAIKENGGKWNEPFVGQLIRELIAVYSCPVYHILPDGSKKIVGVVCVDIGIQWIGQAINEFSLENQGRAILISDKLQVLAGPHKENIGKHVEDLDYPALDYLYVEATNDFQRITTQKSPGSFIVTKKATGKKARCFWHPMKSTGWFFGVLFSERKICSPMRFFRSAILIMSVVIFLVIVTFIGAMAYRTSLSLKKIRGFLREIGKGNFAASIPETKGEDEFTTLIAAIDRMRLSLIQYTEDLKKITIVNERIESELLIAQQIQAGFMPDIQASFSNSPFFDVSAKMLPAKEIGGDLFDCVLTAPGKLYFMIGDVSGKGIPAALFMVFTQMVQYVLRYTEELPPKNLVSKVNDILCDYNKERLFVTCICGFIDAQTGRITYCNAGHNPFLILKNDGSLLDSCQRNGIPLGVRKGVNYTESTCLMEPGDTLLLYTDGITDAENPSGEFYGSTRLKETLRLCAGKNLSSQEVENEIATSARAFTLSAPQSDDATMLTIRYKKRSS